MGSTLLTVQQLQLESVFSVLEQPFTNNLMKQPTTILFYFDFQVIILKFTLSYIVIHLLILYFSIKNVFFAQKVSFIGSLFKVYEFHLKGSFGI